MGHMSRGFTEKAWSAQDRRKVCRFIQKALGLKLQRLREKGRKKDPCFLAEIPHEIWELAGAWNYCLGGRFFFSCFFTSYFICFEYPFLVDILLAWFVWHLFRLCIHPFVRPEKLSYLQWIPAFHTRRPRTPPNENPGPVHRKGGDFLVGKSSKMTSIAVP